MKTALHICALVLFTISLLTSCSTPTLPIPTIQHSIDSITEFNEIWTLNNIYINQIHYSPMSGSIEGRFCFLGNLSNQAEQKIICLNATNGVLLWEKSASSSSAIAVSPKGVFIGTSGIAGVARYNLDGDFIWDNSFTGNGILRIYVVDNEVQIFNHPDKLRMLDVETGNVKRKIEGDTIFIATKTEKFIYTYNLQLIEPDTGVIKWEADVANRIRMTPLFTQDVIYIREGEIMGRTYAINRANGETLWKIDENIISNIAYSSKKERVYVLTRDGKLLSIDVNSGVASTLIRFSKTPFILNGEQQVGGYEVAYDDSTNIVFVILGDSRQLFAFQEK